ncbi:MULTISPECIES: OFA family MFS transporter [unclassified Sphingomonas]|uniref:OFA family MFS transporter n=1 Tax=unclassified Sphingomonas TaxID=196159 RepID=UPI00226A3AD1|nr:MULTISPECIES: OFA family MFS transporter [unclassified Sphingomonas]
MTKDGATSGSAAGGFLDRARSIAPPGFNRWLVPPCALAIHLCIGMAYGFSVFWLPLSHAIGIADPVACPGMTLGQALVTTRCDWRVSDLVWIYSIFFVVLGVSAALWGGWLERVGPRKAGVVAACAWCGGIAIGAIGVSVHQLWLLWLGTGLIGGIGLGIGYISPVSTLIKWFPDKRGMATGMAIMGFGGGAMIGSPLADKLMKHFADASQIGVWQTFLVLATIYVAFMMAGALGFRVPPTGWAPAGQGSLPEVAAASGFHVHLKDAHRTPQFWLVWVVLLLNVSASIGIIGIASPMLQEIFGGRLIDHPGQLFAAFADADKKAAATVGAGFVGVISLFNIAGRFFWASSSDRLGRKPTYAIMTALGALLYGLAAPALADRSIGLFILLFCVCASMYGGGFATVPAYLADLFGTRFVGAIHGRILTAWSVAGVLGPYLVTTMRDDRMARGIAGDQLYQPIYWVLGGLLAAAFLLNLAIRPVDSRFHMAAGERAGVAAATDPAPATAVLPADRLGATALLAWAAVCLPIAWGIYQTLAKAAVLLK